MEKLENNKKEQCINMAKLVIYYDPTDFPSATPDSFCEAQANRMVDIANNSKSYVSFVVSNHLVIDYIRRAVVRDRIEPDDVEIEFNGQKIKMYSNGGLDPWPDGFCDHTDKVLLDILTERPEAYRKSSSE